MFHVWSSFDQAPFKDQHVGQRDLVTLVASTCVWLPHLVIIPQIIERNTVLELEYPKTVLWSSDLLDDAAQQSLPEYL